MRKLKSQVHIHDPQLTHEDLKKKKKVAKLMIFILHRK